MTQIGMILGTAAYMSPEQARGKAVDQRADIWAFGCVLYEMLTGRRAFDGEDVPDTLSRVLQREPDFAALPDRVAAGGATTPGAMPREGSTQAPVADCRGGISDRRSARGSHVRHERSASAAPVRCDRVCWPRRSSPAPRSAPVPSG